MNRRFVLIISDGTGSNLCQIQGIHIDERIYLSFFRSPEGGAWTEEEILKYNQNNLKLDYLESELEEAKQSGTPIEYVLIVYSGHGYTDLQGNIHFKVAPDSSLGLNDLLSAVEDTRCLIIADSCRTVNFSTATEKSSYLFFALSRLFDDHYNNLCREKYNEMILATPSTIKTILFASSYDEEAK